VWRSPSAAPTLSQHALSSDRMGVGAIGTFLLMDELEHHRCGAGVMLESRPNGEIEIAFVSNLLLLLTRVSTAASAESYAFAV
jgi:hypothetical protein